MYMVFNGNKPAGNIKHTSYEDARNRMRRLIRRVFHNGEFHLPAFILKWNIRKV